MFTRISLSKGRRSCTQAPLFDMECSARLLISIGVSSERKLILPPKVCSSVVLSLSDSSIQITRFGQPRHHGLQPGQRETL